MESWGNARFQAKSHVTEKSEGATYGQDITPAILNGFGDKEIFHHTAKLLCQRAYRLRFFIKATPHKCNDTHCRIAILWKAIGLPRTFARKSALTQAARQGLSARIRFANANMMLNLAPCFSSPRYRVFRKRSCFLTTPNTCSTFARTEDFACSAFFAAY